MNKLLTIGAMGVTGIASAAVFAFPMGSAVANVGDDAGISARHGHHNEPGDDHGHHSGGHHNEPGDDHGHHNEPGDDHGHHNEPGDDHGHHGGGHHH